MAGESTIDLRVKLLRKLQGINKRSTHLNATIGRSRDKLDLVALDKIQAELSNDFLKQLLTQQNLSFRIPFKEINEKLLQFLNEQKEKSESKEENNEPDKDKEALESIKALDTVKKKLEFLEAYQKEEFNEFGTKSFAFGYPLIIKQMKVTPEATRDIICAPIFIWYLDITRDYRTDSIVISRNEDNPILFNEMLDYYLQTEAKIDFSEEVQFINNETLNDGFMDLEEIDTSIKKLVSKLSNKIDTTRSSWDLEAIPKDKQEAVKSLRSTGMTETIVDGGLFGVFKSGKQSIINDLKNLIDLETETTLENIGVGSTSGHEFTTIETDPTQQKVLGSLSKSQNLIIQGPPGTGKSQTLTALITNALANGKKTLVVCEKRTAMDIIAKNLDKCGLNDYFVTIENVNGDRTITVDKARNIYDLRRNTLQASLLNNDKEYDQAVNSYADAAKIIIAHHKCIAALSEKGFKDNKMLIGDFWQFSQKVANKDPLELCKSAFDNIPFDYDKIEFKNIDEELRRVGPQFVNNDSIVAQIPKQKILKNKTFDADRDLLKTFFLDHSKELKQLKTSADERMADLIGSYVASKEKRYAKLKDLVAFAIQILSVERKNFDWKSIRDILQSDKEESIRSNQAVDVIAKLDTFQGYKHSFQANATQLLTNINGLVKDYTKHLENAKNLLDSLSKFGVHEIELSKLGHLAPAISSKQKNIKQLKVELLAQIENINSIKAKQPDILGKAIAPNVNVAAAIDDWIKDLPDNAQVMSYIYTLDASLFADPASIDESRSNMLVKEYVHYITDRQFAEFTRLKHFLWQQYYSQLILLAGNSSVLSQIIHKSESSEDYSDNTTTYLDSVSKSSLSKESLRSESELDAYGLSIKEDQDMINLKQQTTNLLESGEYSQAYLKLQNKMETIEQCKDFVDFIDILVNTTDDALHEIDDNYFAYYSWCEVYLEFNEKVRQTVDCLSSCGIGQSEWPDYFGALYFEKLVKDADRAELLKNDLVIDKLSSNDKKIKSLLLHSIESKWNVERDLAISNLEGSGLKFYHLFNKRGSAGRRRNSLRKIIARDFDLFTALFPVIICNPGTTASLFRLEKDLFDIVLFDEASQLRLEDTYTSLYRGKVKIVSGDEHQMPPSSYFQTAGIEEDVDYDTDEGITIQELLNSESLLEYASNHDYLKSMLQVHYRSDHEDLIKFSNCAFYEGKLLPITSLEQYIPIEFYQVNGQYADQKNNDEANKIIDWISQYLTKTDRPSIGVVTLNLNQAELIRERIAEKRTSDATFDQLMAELEHTGFFVKNLENIQGDERDIMVLSTTFGVKADGSFIQNFGPLNQKNGYRLLNVLVTRAIHKFIVFTSIPIDKIYTYSEEIKNYGKTGKGIFYAYLAYARAVSNGDESLKQAVLEALESVSDESQTSRTLFEGLTESPFEEEVLGVLENSIDKERIKLQYPVGSEKFRIDMVILDPDKTRPMLAVECDGYAYHSSPDAYLYDLYRQRILESKGFKFYRIWSTNWFHDQSNEAQKLLRQIQNMDEAFGVSSSNQTSDTSVLA